MARHSGSTPTVLRHYTRGWLVLLLLAAAVQLVIAVVPTDLAAASWAWVAADGSRWLLVAAAVLVLPAMIGWLGQALVQPLLARRQAWRGFLAFEDGLVTEFAPDSGRTYKIVVIDHPRDGVGTMGVLTGMIPAPEGDGELAAVFVPTAPNPLRGTIRVVSADSFYELDWTLREFWSFQLSYGAAVPHRGAGERP